MSHTIPSGLLCFMLPLAAQGQMFLQGETQLHVQEGTSLRVLAPVTWEIGASTSLENDGSIVLGHQARLLEPLDHAIFGMGTESVAVYHPAPLENEEPGGLGLFISTENATDSLWLVRGHQSLTDSADRNSVARWYTLETANENDLDATLSFRFTLNEALGLDVTDLRLHRQVDGDIWQDWATTVDLPARTATAEGLNGPGTYTLFEGAIGTSLGTHFAPNTALLYPTITDGPLWIRNGRFRDRQQLEAFDLHGRRVRVFTASACGQDLWCLDISELPSGTYLLRAPGVPGALPFFRR